MTILIKKQTLVEDVKRLFANTYPFLKIELYKLRPDTPGNQTKKQSLPFDFVLHKLLKSPDDVVINLNKDITVAQLENQFENLGLGAEIFRKSGTVWVETSLTHNWTLQQQNEEAEEISQHFNTKKIF